MMTKCPERLGRLWQLVCVIGAAVFVLSHACFAKSNLDPANMLPKGVQTWPLDSLPVKAAQAFETDNYSEAAAYLEKFLDTLPITNKTQPERQACLAALGRIYGLQERVVLAAKLYEQALACGAGRDLQTADILKQLAMLYERCGNAKRSEKLWHQALAIEDSGLADPIASETIELFGDYLQRQNRMKESAQQYALALSRLSNPGDAKRRLYCKQAVLAERFGNMAECAACYKKALGQCRKTTQRLIVLEQLGAALIRQHKFAEAVAVNEQACQLLNPKKPEELFQLAHTYCSRAQICEHWEHLGQARLAYQKAWQCLCTRPEENAWLVTKVLQGLVRLASKDGNYAFVQTCLQETLKRWPLDPGQAETQQEARLQVCLLLAEALVAGGELEQAKKLYRDIIAMRIGGAKRSTARSTASSTDPAAVLGMDTTFKFLAHVGLAEIYGKQGMFTEEHAELDRAGKISLTDQSADGHAALLEQVASQFSLRKAVLEAILVQKQAQRQYIKAFGKGSDEAATGALHAGYYLCEALRWDEAEAEFLESLRIWDGHRHEDNSVAFLGLHSLANMYNRLGQMDKCIIVADRALKLADGNEKWRSQVIDMVARLHLHRGDNEHAEALLLDALKYTEKRKATRRIKLLTDLSRICRRTGREVQADAYLQQALQERGEGKIKRVFPALLALSHAYLAAGDMNASDQMLTDGVAAMLAEKSPEDLRASGILQAIPSLYARGHYQEAEAVCKHAIAVCRRQRHLDRIYLSMLLVVEGRIYIDWERWSEADNALREAYALRVRAGGPDNPGLSEVVNLQARCCLGKAALAHGAERQALLAKSRQLNKQVQKLAPLHLAEQAVALVNMAEAEIEDGNLAVASTKLAAALNMLAHQEIARRSVNQSLVRVARLYDRLRDYKQAEDLCHQIQANQDPVASDNTADNVIEAGLVLSSVYEQQKMLDQAVSATESASATAQRWLDKRDPLRGKVQKRLTSLKERTRR